MGYRLSLVDPLSLTLYLSLSHAPAGWLGIRTMTNLSRGLHHETQQAPTTSRVTSGVEMPLSEEPGEILGVSPMPLGGRPVPRIS